VCGQRWPARAPAACAMTPSLRRPHHPRTDRRRWTGLAAAMSLVLEPVPALCDVRRPRLVRIGDGGKHCGYFQHARYSPVQCGAAPLRTCPRTSRRAGTTFGSGGTRSHRPLSLSSTAWELRPTGLAARGPRCTRSARSAGRGGSTTAGFYDGHRRPDLNGRADADRARARLSSPHIGESARGSHGSGNSPERARAGEVWDFS
jgi:hypothetical protein